MKKSFQYSVQVNSQTIQRAERWLELCRRLYNAALEQRITAYRRNRISISKFAQMKELPFLKQELSEYKDVDAQSLQDVLERLDKAYQAFFRRMKNGDTPGFPRFKGQNRYNSFTLKQTGWKIDGKYLIVKKIGRFKIRLSRPIEGVIKTITIRRTPTDKWFVVFSCDDVPTKPLPATGKEVGIDVGCENFLTNSDGRKIENPRLLKQSEDVLKVRQQAFSRKVKGSHRRNKARILVAKTHEKIRNQRRDFHFKTANQLLRNNDVIYIEKFNSWNGWKNLNRSMRDVSWFGFFSILKAKAEEAVREVIEVPARGTSQRCSGCGQEVPKDLSVRVHRCPFCHLILDRDHNAAINILRAGQALRNPCATRPENLLALAGRVSRPSRL